MGKELPHNWVETDFKVIVDYQKGKKPKILKDEEFENSVPYLDIKAFEKNEYDRYGDIESSNIIEEDSIGIVWDGARSGWVGIGKYGAVGSTIAILRPKLINSQYTYRYLQSQFDHLNTNTRGTGIPHVDPQFLWNLQFPLAPLPEQQRIVAKLDSLFTHLEEAKTRLEKVPELLKQFRQSVLTQAVTGKLTEDWSKKLNSSARRDFNIVIKMKNDLMKSGRLKKNKLEPVNEIFLITELAPERWVIGVFDDIFRFIDYRGKTPVKTDQGRRLITAKNIKMGHLSDEPIEYMSEEGYEKWMIRGFPKEKDIFFVTEGHTMGNVALNDRSDEFALAQRTLTLQPFSNINTTFFFYMILTNRFQVLVDTNATGTAAKGIKAAKFKNLPLVFPSFEEQNEIVRRVNGLFAKADAIEAKYKELKEQIDNLPQALLAKAFKGELVEQLPTDGDARELLEEIKRLKTKK